ncbi:capsule assembly Wzi family protein, partial [Paraglaciecola sp.]|uniref:capsule assembly Wzi family protein n=1 Tax=Paraglaciecola sp. TaxID=1920173 RepID=UPI0030F456A3
NLGINLILYSVLCSPVNASPWVGTDDPQLYNDVVTLAEWGYIEAATTTYPLPWKGISEQLNTLDTTQLPASAAIATQRLRQFIQRQQLQKNTTSLSLYTASEESRFTSFDAQHSEQTQVNFTQQFNSGAWSAQLSLNHQPNDHKTSSKNNFDQSYVSYQFDNWSLRVGALNQWWGPAQSSSLILSNNARPIPTIALSRAQAVASKNSWASFLGPWYFTAQMGQLESDRAIPNTKLWLSRFSFKPIKGLEIGASWTAMWGGKGQGNGLSDLVAVLTFKAECANGASSCDSSLDTKKGNHLAGFDLKYSFLLFEQPFNLYAQRIGEDAVNYYKVTDQASLFGLSSYVGDAKVYIEFSDTNVACGYSGSTTKNCYYEHSEYQSGYRFHHRAIGSTFDSDAKMLTLGFNKHFIDGAVLELFMRRLHLNEDQQTPSPVVNGLTEKLLQLGGFYQTTLGNWQLKLGGQIEKSEVDKHDSDTNSMFYSELEYRLR